MTRLVNRLGLPLLSKELIEQSARKRTYVIRVLYAVMLFFIAFLFFYEKLREGAVSPLAVLGSGRYLFTVLEMLGFAGIYLFMPAITCGVISQEKERASLQLLFLTRLGPWTILFEKLLGRLIPMCGFLLLSLPLLGFAYTLGGISQSLLWTGVWFLVLAAVQMGTLALACSAYFRTTVGAFVSSYVIGFIMLFGPYFVSMVAVMVSVLLGIHLDRIFGSNSGLSFAMLLLLMAPFFGVAWFVTLEQFPGALGNWLVVAHTIVILSVSVAFLLIARRALVARAFVPPRDRVREALSTIDEKLFGIKEQQPTRLAPSDPAELPEYEPIAWRETAKRSLGRPRYLLLLLAVIELPLLLVLGLFFVSAWFDQDVSQLGSMVLGLMWMILWALAVLIISVRSASLIAGERSHQTLDVLCTTPLTGREILMQKMRGLRRLTVLLAVPFGTLFLFQVLWTTVIVARRAYNWRPEFDPLKYLVCSGLGVAVYLPLTAWLSLLIGLKVRSQARAIIGALATIVAGCVAPLIFLVTPLGILFQFAAAGSFENKLVSWSSLTSPAAIVFLNEFNGLEDRSFGDANVAVFVNFAVYAGLLFGIRRLCLARADRWLGRSDAEGAATVANDKAPTPDAPTENVPASQGAGIFIAD